MLVVNALGVQSRSAMQANTLQHSDLGGLLLAFFQRFNLAQFDPSQQAVSVRLGGVVSRWRVPAAAALEEKPDKREALVVEDPLTQRWGRCTRLPVLLSRTCLLNPC